MKPRMWAVFVVAGTLVLAVLSGAASAPLHFAGSDSVRAPATSRPLSHLPWSANEKVNDDSATAMQRDPAITLDSSGNLYAIWEDTRDGNYDLYFSYRPADGTWDTNVRVNDDAGTVYQFLPAITVDSSANAYAVWEDRRNDAGDIYFSYRPAGGSWDSNTRVNDDAGTASQMYPHIAVDSSGNAYALWEDKRNDAGDIYFSYRPAGGSWGTNVRVNDDAGTASQMYPDIAVDPSGNAFAVWVDSRTNTDIYFSYRPAGGSWDTNYRVNDDSGTAAQWYPAIAVDPLGNAYGTWADRRNGNTDIYFSYRPAGGSWDTNTRVDDDPGIADQWWPAIAVEPSGDAYAVWEDERNDSGDIYFSYRPAGTSWHTNVRVSDDSGTETVEDSRPAIAVDSSGNAYAVWYTDRNDTGDIYFSYWSSDLPPDEDADGDGLLNAQEEDGIDQNDDGVLELDLPGMGADPLHKDIFVEVDYMQHHKPSAAAIQDVIDAFAAAPVTNPDALDGINLHVVVDEEIPHQDSIDVWQDFDFLKGQYFGTSAERACPNWSHIREARRIVFRYSLFVHQYNNSDSSGIAELPGNDFIVSLGHPGFLPDSTGHHTGDPDQQAGTFMHELGHTLGLHHGGYDPANCKPNYLSIMSYSRQFDNIIRDRPLDYSHSDLPTLAELHLDEADGIQGPPSMSTTYGPPRDTDGDGDMEYPVAAAEGAIDWDGNGTIVSDVSANINYLGFHGCNDPDSAEELGGYDDWQHLLYDFTGTPNYADGTHSQVAADEITAEVLAEIYAITADHTLYLPLTFKNH